MTVGVLHQKDGAGKATLAPAPVELMKRFIVDVPVSLHTRIKTQCARRGVKMADVLRGLMEREFPKA
ncbi:MAG TPA: plasmid partition protein ParG [Microvirga sp.]|nr:plasmid partition protein ParG [Microvirga sp.]